MSILGRHLYRFPKTQLKHRQLVVKAGAWLQFHQGCGVVFLEGSGADGEIPDAIGWKGNFSIMIECKVSRADFFADEKKPARSFSSLGYERYYMVPTELVKPEEVPDGWGLIYTDGHCCYKVVEPKLNTERDLFREVGMLVSGLRKVKIGAMILALPQTELETITDDSIQDESQNI